MANTSIASVQSVTIPKGGLGHELRATMVVWEREMSFRLVARYVRILAASEDPGTSQKMMQVFLAELRQLEDRLLLSPKSKVQNRYAVRVPEEVTPIAGVPAAVVSPRDRLKAAAAAS